jgi:hypothetical protein
MSSRAADWLAEHAEEHAGGAVADLNQYWYSANTIATLIQAVKDQVDGMKDGVAPLKVAYISTPSLFFALDAKDRTGSRVLDFDKSLGAGCDEFVFYDFHHPTALPAELKHAFSLVVIDPPYIEQDVWQKYVQTAKFLLVEGGYVVGTTVIENGALLEAELGVTPNVFLPSIPHLPYQYAAFTNFQSPALSVRNPEVAQDPEEILHASRETALDRGPGAAEAPIRGAGAAYDFEAMLEAELRRTATGAGGGA